MKRLNCWILTLLLSVSTLFGTIGFGSWFIKADKTKSYGKDPNDACIVCRIGTKYFTDIGKAIKTSTKGDVIEVIPGNTNRESKYYVISTDDDSKEITIPEGVTLSIPYELGATNKKIAEGTTKVHAFDDRAKYCKSSVILGDGISLINNGTIEIGGIIGAGNGGPSGCTAGNYSELILGIGSKLINHNTINLYGYIGEKKNNCANIIIKPELNNVRPVLNFPLYWYDFCGGSALIAIYDCIGSKYCLPLDDFYFENIGAKTTIFGGSDVFSWTNIYAADKNGEYDLKLIGSDTGGIINLPAGSYLESDYDESTLVNSLSFYGNAAFNALTIDVEKAIKDTAGSIAWLAAKVLGIPSKVTSTAGYYPVSYHFNIELNKLENEENAVFDGSSNRYKFLNASALKIGPNVTLNVKELVAYKGDDIYSGRGAYASSLQKSKKPLTPAMMNVCGKLVGETIAGYFESDVSGGTINAKNSTSVTMYEPKKGKKGWNKAKMLDGEEGWYYLPFTLKLRDSSNSIQDRTPGRYDSFNNGFVYWDIVK